MKEDQSYAEANQYQKEGRVFIDVIDFRAYVEVVFEENLLAAQPEVLVTKKSAAMLTAKELIFHPDLAIRAYCLPAILTSHYCLPIRMILAMHTFCFFFLQEIRTPQRHS